MPPPPVALVGYGRLGQVLASLCQRAGARVRAFDPHSPPPDTLRAATVREVVDGAALVVLAVPFNALEPCLRELAPLLQPHQLVLDTCSVKVKPVEVLARCMPAGVPWVGSHPLFGPRSVARDDRPRRAVICPNPAFPQAAAGA